MTVTAYTFSLLEKTTSKELDIWSISMDDAKVSPEMQLKIIDLIHHQVRLALDKVPALAGTEDILVFLGIFV